MEKLTNLLLTNKNIKSKYDEIQKVDTTSYYHGYQHIMNVLKTLQKFIDLFGIDEHEADKLSIAILFHDIGRGSIGKGHEEKSANYMKEYLSKFDLSKFNFTQEDITEIDKAIRIHEQKEDLDKLSLFELLVNFVDKLDVTKERINLNNPLNPELPSYKYDIFREIYLDVNDVNPIIEDNALVLEFEGNENLSLERLYKIPFMQVVDKLHKEFARRYNLDTKVRISTTHKKRNELK